MAKKWNYPLDCVSHHSNFAIFRFFLTVSGGKELAAFWWYIKTHKVTLHSTAHLIKICGLSQKRAFIKAHHNIPWYQSVDKKVRLNTWSKEERIRSKFRKKAREKSEIWNSLKIENSLFFWAMRSSTNSKPIKWRPTSNFNKRL